MLATGSWRRRGRVVVFVLLRRGGGSGESQTPGCSSPLSQIDLVAWW